jgi:hypothetical protein
VDAIDRTGIDRLLNHVFRVSILADDTGATVIGFDVERIASDVGAVLAADAGNLIDVNALLPQVPAEFGF